MTNGKLTKAVDLATEFDEFSRWPRTENAHRLHSNATGTGSKWLRAVSYGSCAFVAAAVGPLKRNHCPIFPMGEELQLISIASFY